MHIVKCCMKIQFSKNLSTGKGDRLHGRRSGGRNWFKPSVQLTGRARLELRLFQFHSKPQTNRLCWFSCF